jgi:hypothetical protein
MACSLKEVKGQLYLIIIIIIIIIIIKVQVKVPLRSNWAPRHKGVLGEWRYSSTHCLTLALDVGEWSASRRGRFTPGKDPWDTMHRRMVGLRAGPDAVSKRKIPSPCRESNPDRPARSESLYRLSYPSYIIIIIIIIIIIYVAITM